MVKYLLFCLTALLTTGLFAQTHQIDINRVTLMPNMPSPYVMRDWKNVAVKYDSFIFNLNASGQFLPVMKLKSSGTNYPSVQPILLDSYVGSASHGTQAEAVNIIPSVVGASLVGIDKSNQFGNNWVLSVKDFFNKANGQNVYLNGSSSASGADWWYDLMPNIFFYQLYSLYPSTQDFDSQFISVADQWLAAVKILGGSTTPWNVPQMNYRGFNLATMQSNSNGVSEPEGAGTIAWLLYHAYIKTGNKKYLEGAQMAISFLSSLNSNPAYEIQLPYGTFIAAKMNAELGTNYNIQKMINWSFDQSAERNWGTIVGTWGNSVTGSNDVSGLVGEVDNPNTGYAFTMNGFEQAAAFVPLIKYDKRFARTVAKWALNLANASRLFYSAYLPASHQDGYLWSSVNDKNSVIAYEALKQTGLNDSLLYATGDALRNGWAQTNFGLYGSSHVGYLGSLITTTDVDGILLLDINKTDFFGKNPFPSYVVYNPYASAQNVTLPLGAATYDIYDAISETVIHTGATGNYQINIPANQVMIITYLPQGTTPTPANGKLYVGNNIIDYHYGYNFNGKLLIQSLASKDSLVEYNQQVTIYSSVRNNAAPVTFNWYVNGSLATSSADSIFHWTVPQVAGQYNLKLNITDGVSSANDSIQFAVVDHIPVPPQISSFTADSIWYYVNSTATIVCHASTLDNSALKYSWTVPGGTIINQQDSVLQWQLPATDGLYNVTCTVKNSDSISASSSYSVLVKIRTQITNAPVAYYPFDGDVKDYSGNNHNATQQGVQSTTDARGEDNKAYRFTDGSNIIDIPNTSTLNFQNQITLSFWVKLDAVPAESYVISHGSYQQRWKVSVIPNSKIRWTVKTLSSVVDLDSSFPLQLNQFYHVAVTYTGYSMEMYIDGELNSYVADSGLVAIASTDITCGRQNNSTQSYSLYGTLDEFRIYDKAMGPNEIAILKTLWNTTTITSVKENSLNVEVYPNPASGSFYVKGVDAKNTYVSLIDVMGRSIKTENTLIDDQTFLVNFGREQSGVMILKIETSNGVFFTKILSH